MDAIRERVKKLRLAPAAARAEITRRVKQSKMSSASSPSVKQSQPSRALVQYVPRPISRRDPRDTAHYHAVISRALGGRSRHAPHPAITDTDIQNGVGSFIVTEMVHFVNISLAAGNQMFYADALLAEGPVFVTSATGAPGISASSRSSTGAQPFPALPNNSINIQSVTPAGAAAQAWQVVPPIADPTGISSGAHPGTVTQNLDTRRIQALGSSVEVRTVLPYNGTGSFTAITSDRHPRIWGPDNGVKFQHPYDENINPTQAHKLQGQLSSLPDPFAVFDPFEMTANFASVPPTAIMAGGSSTASLHACLAGPSYNTAWWDGSGSTITGEEKFVYGIDSLEKYIASSSTMFQLVNNSPQPITVAIVCRRRYAITVGPRSPFHRLATRASVHEVPVVHSSVGIGSSPVAAAKAAAVGVINSSAVRDPHRSYDAAEIQKIVQALNTSPDDSGGGLMSHVPSLNEILSGVKKIGATAKTLADDYRYIKNDYDGVPNPQSQKQVLMIEDRPRAAKSKTRYLTTDDVDD